MLLSVVGVPQLGSDKEIIPLDHTFVQCLFDSQSHLYFIPINGGSIQKSVPILNGLEDNPLAVLVRQLPESQTDGRHAVSAGQGECWLVEGNGLLSLSQCGIDHSLSLEGLSRVGSDCVVHQCELTLLPLELAYVIQHVPVDLPEGILGHVSTVTHQLSLELWLGVVCEAREEAEVHK